MCQCNMITILTLVVLEGKSDGYRLVMYPPVTRFIPCQPNGFYSETVELGSLAMAKVKDCHNAKIILPLVK